MSLQIGKQQHYELGKYFRVKYMSLLHNGGYSRNKIYIVSSDKDRTIMSAQANLAGLFPPMGGQVWNKDFDWQPIPVHSLSEHDDMYLDGSAYCPRFNQLYKRYAKEMLKKYKTLHQNMEELTGLSIQDVFYLNLYQDDFFVETIHNYT